MTVDGVHYSREEAHPFLTKMSSHKFGGKAGLMYELVMYTHKAKIAWLNGPFPAGNSDRIVFWNGGSKQAVEEKQLRNKDFWIIADNWYLANDLFKLLSYRDEFDPRKFAYFKDRALARHERMNGWSKDFGILDHCHWSERGHNADLDFPLHKATVEVVFVVIQYELDAGEMTLFDPYPL